MKRIMAFILVVISILCFCSIASAETRASNYFSDYGISLSRQGSGKISFTMSCTSMGTASQLGVSTYSVYRYDEDDGGWLCVSGPHSGSYKYNTTSYALAKTFSGVAGETYRVRCTFLANKSNGTGETKTYTSRSVTAN